MISAHDWKGLCSLIQEGWPGDFDEHTAKAWRVLLDDFDAAEVLAAVKACLARGGRWRPAVSEIVAEIRCDPNRPTFEETYALIYGSRGVLCASAPRGPYPDMATMAKAKDQAARERAAGMHPLVPSFVMRYGLDRLRSLEVDHPEWGGKNRKDLRAAWDRHCEVMEDRDVAALVAGRRGELGRFDPLRALGPKRLEIEERAS